MTGASGRRGPAGGRSARLFIFDVGGVMVDGFDVAPAIAADLGIPVDELRPLMDAAGAEALHDGAITTGEFWRRFKENTGLEPKGEPWGDRFHPARRPAMYALVERLKAGGARVVAGTNTIDPHYRLHLENGDYAAFDHVYASHLMGVSKPEPAFWRRILEAEGVAAHEAFFIDDMVVNVAAAKALGLEAVLFEGQAQAILSAEGAQGGPPEG